MLVRDDRQVATAVLQGEVPPAGTVHVSLDVPVRPEGRDLELDDHRRGLEGEQADGPRTAHQGERVVGLGVGDQRGQRGVEVAQLEGRLRVREHSGRDRVLARCSSAQSEQ